MSAIPRSTPCRAAVMLVAAIAVGLLATATPAQDSSPRPAEEGPAEEGPDRAGIEGLWELRIEREGWRPAVITGHLIMDLSGPFTSRVHFRELAGWDGIDSASAGGDDEHFSLEFEHPAVNVVLSAEVEGDALTGTTTWTSKEGKSEHPFTATRVRAPLFDADDDGWREHAHPRAVGLIAPALERLAVFAAEADSDAVVILKDGKLVMDRTFGHERRPIHAMSITKAVVSLAVPLLIEDRRIKSVDDRLSRWLPTWKKGDKKAVTLRHVLTHTSGLHHDKMAHALNTADDVVALARDSDLATEPGTAFSYNNRAMALLGGVLAKAARTPIDAYLEKRLFTPLGIDDATWMKDASGNLHTYAGLSIEARDLAAIGELVARDGLLGKKQVLPKDWCEAMRQPGSAVSGQVGLTWWLQRDYSVEKVVQTKASLKRFAEAGFEAIDVLKPLTGKKFDGRQAYFAELRKSVRLPKDQARLYDRLLNQGIVAFESDAPVVALYHTGDLGQWLVVYPEHDLVAVRMRDGRRTARLEGEAERRKSFGRFMKMVEASILRE